MPRQPPPSAVEDSAPFKSYQTIFDQETAQAIEELQRPGTGLFISGFIAGAGIGVSVLLLGVLQTHMGDELHHLLRLALTANAYAVGFVLVIMGRTDLFTEYNTITTFPVLTGQARVRSLARVWGLIYLANLIGGGAFAVLLAGIGPRLEIIRPDVYVTIAMKVAGHPWHVILGSAFLAGWLMGLLSWLVIAARDNISQVFFIWLIAGVIGFSHLHHAIVGAIEIFLGMMGSVGVSPGHFFHFLLWTTVGNTAGGIFFAVLIRYSVLLHKRERSGEGGREN